MSTREPGEPEHPHRLGVRHQDSSPDTGPATGPDAERAEAPAGGCARNCRGCEGARSTPSTRPPEAAEPSAESAPLRVCTRRFSPKATAETSADDRDGSASITEIHTRRAAPAARRDAAIPCGPADDAPSGADRRRHPRFAVAARAKLRPEHSIMFAAGATENISRGGALLRVHGGRSIDPGDRVDVVIAPSSSVVVAAEHVRPAVVRRADHTDDGFSDIAVEFTVPVGVWLLPPIDPAEPQDDAADDGASDDDSVIDADESLREEPALAA
jgi:hypothetical protein